VKIRDVCAAIEELAPPGLAYDWDRAGLSLGDPEAPVTAALVALTVTRGAFRAALRARAQLIVSHHPLIWEPLPALRTDEPHTRLCLDLAQAGVACYAAHTSLDVAPGGLNDELAEQLGLVNRSPLLPVPQAQQVKLVTFVPESHLARLRQAVCDAGAGVIGPYTHCSFSSPGMGTFVPGGAARPFSGEKGRLNEEPELRFETLVDKARVPEVVKAMRAAHPYEEAAYDIVALENRDPAVGLGIRGELVRPLPLGRFARTVRRALAVPHVRVVGDLRQRVRRVAVIGGSGGSEIPNLATHIDVLVTGDVKYAQALAALEKGLALVDAGHAGTEKCMVPLLVRHVKRRLKNLRVRSYVEPEIFSVIAR
jgi:dinuclear metal center YbgI/SA1388 family protein